MLIIIIITATDLNFLSIMYNLMLIDNKFLNSSMVFAFMSSSDRVFLSLIADGKNEYL